jgi:hypothetical protein
LTHNEEEKKKKKGKVHKMTDAPSLHPSMYVSMNHRRRVPQIYQGVAISAWKPDQDSQRCGVCTKRFTIIRRKHHCRTVSLLFPFTITL